MKFLTIVRGACAASAYSFIPFVGLWLLANESAEARQRTLVPLFIFCYRAGSLFCSMAIARLGVSHVSQVLMVISSASLILFFTNVSLPIWTQITCICLAGAALSGTVLCLSTIAANMPSDWKRLEAFSALSVGANAGAALGPLVAGLVMSLRPDLLGLVVCLPLVSCLAFMRNIPGHTASQPVEMQSDDKTSTEWRSIGINILGAIFTWFAFSQVFAVLARSMHDAGDAEWTAWLFALNSSLIILFQRKVIRRTSDLRMSMGIAPTVMLISGNLVTGLGLVGMYAGVGQSIALCFVSIGFFSIGEMIWVPHFEKQVSGDCARRNRPYLLSFISVSRGLAESTGAFVGLAMIQKGGSPFVLGSASNLIGALLLSAVMLSRGGSRATLSRD